MHWLLDNIQIVGAIVVAILYFLKQARAPDQDTEADEEQQARTRRLQDEIRRRIAERQSGGAPSEFEPAQEAEKPEPPVFAPRDFVPPLMRPQSVPPVDTFGGPTRRVENVPPPAPMASPGFDSLSDVVLERQRKLAAQIRALEAERAEEARRAAELATLLAAKEVASDTVSAISARREAGRAPRGSLLADLRGKKNLRRAIVLREVMGPPVGAR